MYGLVLTCIPLLCSTCSHTHSAWPLYISIGNHNAAARDLPCGKNLITFINLPKKRRSDFGEDYRYCFRSLYQAVWAGAFHIPNQWADGFWLVLPGHTQPTLVLPRLGVPVADIMELRNLAAVTSTCAIRCDWKFGGPLAGVEGQGAVVGDVDMDEFIAQFMEEPVDTPSAVPAGPGHEGDSEGDVGAPADDDDPPCNPEEFAVRLVRPEVRFHSLLVVYHGKTILYYLYTNVVFVIVVLLRLLWVVVCCLHVQCKPRDPATRSALLRDIPFEGRGGLGWGEARKEYTSVGLHPFIMPAIEDPAFAPFTGPPSVLPSMRMTADNMHMVHAPPHPPPSE